MVKRLITTIFLVAILSSSFDAIPPHTVGEGGCGSECCIAARGDSDRATISGVCCMTECRQSAEMLIFSLAIAGASPKPVKVTPALSPLINDLVSYLQQTRFPDSPTRFINGSSSRYLDTATLLI